MQYKTQNWGKSFFFCETEDRDDVSLSPGGTITDYTASYLTRL